MDRPSLKTSKCLEKSRLLDNDTIVEYFPDTYLSIISIKLYRQYSPHLQRGNIGTSRVYVIYYKLPDPPTFVTSGLYTAYRVRKIHSSQYISMRSITGNATRFIPTHLRANIFHRLPLVRIQHDSLTSINHKTIEQNQRNTQDLYRKITELNIDQGTFIYRHILITIPQLSPQNATLSTASLTPASSLPPSAIPAHPLHQPRSKYFDSPKPLPNPPQTTFKHPTPVYSPVPSHRSRSLDSTHTFALSIISIRSPGIHSSPGTGKRGTQWYT